MCGDLEQPKPARRFVSGPSRGQISQGTVDPFVVWGIRQPQRILALVCARTTMLGLQEAGKGGEVIYELVPVTGKWDGQYPCE